MSGFDIRAAIEIAFEDYKKDLAELVSANSKNAEAKPGAPMGKGARQALDTMLAIAKRLGFKTTIDAEGYYGYADIGEGKELFGILGHMDVVPADDTENWETDPFVMAEKDGKFWGRGVIDDKGPTLASLYAMKILLDSGIELKQRVRFIFCTDEESLWRSVKRYIANEEHPSFGITPDADFPLLFAEKGLVEYDLFAKDAKVVDLKGGTAYNAVAGEASIPMDKEVKKQMDMLGYEYQEKKGRLVAKGKSAHAMEPESGVNAIVHLMEAMYKAGDESSMVKFIAEVGNTPFGTGIFGNVVDEISGKLKFNVGLIDYKYSEQKMGIDIRFPVTYEKEKVDKALAEVTAKYNIEVQEFNYLRPIYLATDTPFVKTLMQAYQEVTGDTKTQPLSTGGATFARSMENIVAYGALFPGRPQTEHQANEMVIIDDLKKAQEIYFRAFELLLTKEKIQ